MAIELTDLLSPKLMIRNFGIADSRPHNYVSTRCNGGGLGEESAKDTKGLLPLSQPDPKGGQLGLIKPHAEGRASSVPCVGQCSQPSPVHLDTKNILYAGEKSMPKLVTAESCVGEEIPDPQSK